MENKRDTTLRSTVIGLFIMSGTWILKHFAKLPDVADGLLTGVGIGIMLLPFLQKKKRLNCNES